MTDKHDHELECDRIDEVIHAITELVETMVPVGDMVRLHIEIEQVGRVVKATIDIDHVFRKEAK